MATSRKARKEILDELAPYIDCGITLVPLHEWDAHDRFGRNLGKAPRDAGWTEKDYNSRTVVERCINNGWNVGARIEDTWCVVDVDPKNGGEESFAELCDALNLDPSEWPRVETGSGGSHFYLRTPAGAKFVNCLVDQYPGVEFKGVGRQVVAAGSRHPNGRKYWWDQFDNRLELAAAPDIPDSLLEAIQRRHSASDAEAGEWTPEELASALEGLDPSEFRDEESWRNLMFSCHHATAGEGLDVFADWSRSDTGYGKNNTDIEQRWNSIDADHPEPITVAFLNKCLRDAGNPHLQLKKTRSAREEFNDDISWMMDEEKKWPRPLRYEQNGNSRQNAARFLRHRPERLISSNKTFYSLDRQTRLWKEVSDHTLAVEINKTDRVNLLGHQKIEAIADAIHMLEHTSSRPFEWIDELVDAPDANESILFRDGLLNLKTRDLIPHTGAYFATGTPEFAYDRDAGCPIWMEKISEWLDESFHDTLQEFMGYAMTPDVRYEVFLLMLGVPRGGKGTIMNVMQKLVGPKHHTSRTLNDLGNDFGLDGIIDKRLIFIPDAHNVGRGKHTTALERIKSITGRDELSINRKNKDIVTSQIPAKLVIAANQLPKFIDESGALSARQLILKFENSFKGREDRDLRSKLEAELPGIANWALVGLDRLRANGGKFTIGERGRQVAREAAKSQSPALRFASYALQITGDPADFVKLADVHQHYKHWVSEIEDLQGGEVRGRNDLKDDLEAALLARGVKYHDAQKYWNAEKGKASSRRGFSGIRLKRDLPLY
jgi:P4 family phage/plasmid primase-like protien